MGFLEKNFVAPIAGKNHANNREVGNPGKRLGKEPLPSLALGAF